MLFVAFLALHSHWRLFNGEASAMFSFPGFQLERYSVESTRVTLDTQAKGMLINIDSSIVNVPQWEQLSMRISTNRQFETEELILQISSQSANCIQTAVPVTIITLQC